MELDGYLEGIQGAWLGEQFGAALFRALAERTDDQTMRSAWLTLARLAQVTGNKLAVVLAEHGEPAGNGEAVEVSEDIVDRYADATQAVSADGAVNEAHTQAMLNMKELVEHAIVRFDQLLAVAPEADVPTVQFLVHHEQALLTFVDCELAGDRAHALQDVEQLLAQAV